jgi:hypothetical protein
MYVKECGVVCHTKCADLVPDFCGMTMEKANLMLSEMKAANNRRRTFHSDSLLQHSADNNQKPFSSNTFLSSSQISWTNVSPQASISTPVSPKLGPTQSNNSLSFSHDTSSFHTLANLFNQSGSAIPEPSTKMATQLVQWMNAIMCLLIYHSNAFV